MSRTQTRSRIMARSAHNIGFAVVLILSIMDAVQARIHRLSFEEDRRNFILVSSFGFNRGGYLEVSVNNFSASPMVESDLFGFSLDRTISDAVSSFTESHTKDRCVLAEPNAGTNAENLSAGLLRFKFDFAKSRVAVDCSSQLQGLGIYLGTESIPRDNLPPARRKKKANLNKKGDTPKENDSLVGIRARRDVGAASKEAQEDSVAENDSKTEPQEPSVPERPSENLAVSEDLDFCKDLVIPMNSTGPNSFSAKFVVYIKSEKEEGRYHLYFHNCKNYKHGQPLSAIDLDLTVVEVNGQGSFLSAGEMPLPPLFFLMSVLFFFVGLFWMFILRKSKSTVFKIHYLMAALVFAKSLSLLFHGINYHYIELSGTHVEAWAVLYYIIHLLKGALLFITIVLIGSGWAFIKGILSDKEKKIFLIVIPLQVLSNIAMIIFEESEESEVGHSMWNEILILVDLVCCGAILLPIVWSIRHLQEAAETDGKAAMNLRKLVLFRHFYVMIVCYIYSTRIVVYLLKITLPFNYAWIDDMFRETATFVFFVMTGYKFRPAASNPYLQIPQEDDIDVEDEAVTLTGLTENMKRHTRGKRTILGESSDDEDGEEVFDAMALLHVARSPGSAGGSSSIAKREASHDYD